MHQAQKENKKTIVHVILNRLDSSIFPNTINEIIFQEAQFTYRDDVESSTIDAVREALNEEDNTGGALFFCVGYSSYHETRTFIFMDDLGVKFYK